VGQLQAIYIVKSCGTSDVVPPGRHPDKAGTVVTLLSILACSACAAGGREEEPARVEESSIWRKNLQRDYLADISQTRVFTMITRESPRKAITDSRNGWIRERCVRGSSILIFPLLLLADKEQKDLVGYSTLESRVRRQRRESDESQPGVRDHRFNHGRQLTRG